jgi:transposase
MRRIKEVLRLHFDAGLSNEKISGSLKISKGTVFNTIEKFKNCEFKWPLKEGVSESKLEELLYPEKKPATQEPTKVKPDYHIISKEILKPHVTLQILFEEFKEQCPDGIGRSAFYYDFKRYMSKHDLKMPMNYKGGDKLLIDYSGDGLSYLDKETGELIQTQMFVASWGASSYTYMEHTHTQKQEEWVSSHVRMQDYFGCVPHAYVPDNLKSGVIKPSLYEPKLNPLYLEMAKHYNAAILPARVKKPRDKGVVESNVLHLQHFILGRFRNRVFFSLQEINHETKQLLEDFNNRPMKDYGGQSRKQRFLELDKPFTKLLPEEKFSINKIKEGIRVGPNYHVEFDSHHYSVPYTLVSERVSIYQTDNLIDHHKGEHVVRHKKQPPNYGYTTVTEHMPKNHQFVKGISPSWLIFKGGEIGIETANVIKSGASGTRVLYSG